jgi:hypothetical protein
VNKLLKINAFKVCLAEHAPMPRTEVCLSRLKNDGPAAYGGKLTLMSCFYGLGCGANFPHRSTAHLWLQRCEEHERSIMHFARSLNLSLLVINATDSSATKSVRLQQFLSPPRLDVWPHISTGDRGIEPLIDEIGSTTRA